MFNPSPTLSRSLCFFIFFYFVCSFTILRAHEQHWHWKEMSIAPGVIWSRRLLPWQTSCRKQTVQGKQWEIFQSPFYVVVDKEIRQTVSGRKWPIDKGHTRQGSCSVGPHISAEPRNCLGPGWMDSIQRRMDSILRWMDSKCKYFSVALNIKEAISEQHDCWESIEYLAEIRSRKSQLWVLCSRVRPVDDVCE